jgi:glyoxylase I family protein
MIEAFTRRSRAAWLAFLLLLGGCMSQSTTPAPAPAPVTVRYQVTDLDRSIAFYTGQLEFKLGHQAGSAFAEVLRDNLRLILSGPGSSGARPMPDGTAQTPGGWNRIVLYVDDIAAAMARLEKTSTRFRNQVESGPGGKQIQIEDPDGNPIELHEAPREPSAPRR